MKKCKKTAAILFVAAFCGYCLVCPREVRSAAEIGIYRCISVLIPSLYAMMTASALLIKSGLLSKAGKLISPVTRLFFGINGELGAILFFSLIAGYPVGAKMTAAVYREGRLSKRGAELLSGICFGSGTAFIFGCAAPSAEIGRLILISTVSADLIIGILLSPLLRKHCRAGGISRDTAFSADMLTDSIVSAGRSMSEICFCTVIFAVFTEMLEKCGILRLFGDNAVRGALDVTAVSEISLSLPTAAALIAFGGICVFLQISAIFRGELSIVPLVVIRSAAAVLSGVICRLLMPLFMPEGAVDVFAAAGELHRGRSPIPSVMLIIMTAMLQCSASAVRRGTPAGNPRDHI